MIENILNNIDKNFYISTNKNIIIINTDMFDDLGLRNIRDNSIDAIITDFPYGTLNKRNGWDRIIDFELFWSESKRIGKTNMPTISTAQMPFTSALVSSNYNDFKYTLVWEKSKATGYLNAKKQPMRAHEDIVVFYKKQATYNPQMTQGNPYNKGSAVRDTMAYGKQEKEVLVKNDTGLRYPRSVQYFVTAENEGKYHPTQKPIALFEWLIKTYSNEDEIVLDPCLGSGTTAISALHTGRKFIGFEREKNYFEMAVKRIQKEEINQH